MTEEIRQTFETVSPEDIPGTAEKLKAEGYRLIQLCGVTKEGCTELLYSFDKDFAVRNLKAVVYGPEWNSKSHKSYFSKAVFCNDNKLIVSYSGEDYNTSTTKKLMVFDLEGNYLKTLDVGYDILSMCYDDEQNRLIMNFNDDIQIGYLDLDDLI